MSTRGTSTVALIIGERITPTVYNYFPLPTSVALGTVQLVCSIAVGIVCSIAFGIQIGIIVTLPCVAQWVIAGSFGIAAGAKKTPCLIATNMVMSLVAMLTSLVVFLVASGVLAASQLIKNNLGAYVELKIDFAGYSIALMFFSFVEIVACITSSIVDCKFVCFCCRECCCMYDLTTTDKIRLCSAEKRQLLQPTTAKVLTAADNQRTYGHRLDDSNNNGSKVYDELSTSDNQKSMQNVYDVSYPSCPEWHV